MAQFLVALGNTIIGIVVLPVTQSFFAVNDSFMVESIAPTLYNFASVEGGFAGNFVGGALTMALSFGQATEIFAMALLLVGVIVPFAFRVNRGRPPPADEAAKPMY